MTHSLSRDRAPLSKPSLIPEFDRFYWSSSFQPHPLLTRLLAPLLVTHTHTTSLLVCLPAVREVCMVDSPPGDVMSDGTKPLCCQLLSPSILDSEISFWQIYTKERERVRGSGRQTDGDLFTHPGAMKVRRARSNMEASEQHKHLCRSSPPGGPLVQGRRTQGNLLPVCPRNAKLHRHPVLCDRLLCLSEAATHAWERSHCPGSHKVTVMLSLPVICGAV